MRFFNGYNFNHFINFIIHGRVPSRTIIGAKLKLLDKLKNIDPDDNDARMKISNDIYLLTMDEYHEYRNAPKWFHMRFNSSNDSDGMTPKVKKIIKKKTIADIRGRLDQLENLID